MRLKLLLITLNCLLLIAGYSQKTPELSSSKASHSEISEKIRKDTSKNLLSYNPGGQQKARKEFLRDSLVQNLKVVKEDTNKINTLIGLCRKMNELGNPRAEILSYAQQAKELCERLLKTEKYKNSKPVKKKLGMAITQIGVQYALMGDLQKGIGIIYDALKIREEIGIKTEIANSYLNLGVFYAANQDFTEAAKCHLKCLKLCEEIHDSSGLGFAYFNMGRLYIATKKYDKALSYTLKSAEVRQAIKDATGLAQCYTILSVIYSRNKNYSKALEYNLKAMAIDDSLGILSDIGHTFNNIALNYANLNQYDLSIKYYDKAIKTYELINDSLFLSRAKANLGCVHYEIKNYQKAKELILGSLASLKKHKQTELLEDGYKIISKCDSATGNFREALEYEKLREQIIRENIYSEKLAQLNELQVKYETEKKEKENEALAQQNQIQALQLNRTQYLIFFLSALFCLILIVSVLILRQRRYRTEQMTSQLEQKLLRTQMNPHFIFNALQAIQNYILKHDEKESIRYLSSFANLTRDVLENSRVETISLQKEITLLKNYLELQKLRFGNRFEYMIHVAHDIDPKAITIAPMLSQPFIENAIEHGLNDIESGGRIDIYFAVKDHALLMEIVDNGKGMSHDALYVKDHSSLAMDITKERIALMNKKAGKKASFTVSDAFDPDAMRKGVRINFTIPLQFHA